MKSGDIGPGAFRGGAVPAQWDQRDLKLMDLLPPGCKRVLELGCGDGRLGEAIKNRHPGLFYLGLEADPTLAQAAAARLDRVESIHPDHFDWAATTALSGPDFDCIILDGTLGYLAEPERACIQAAKRLNRDGALIIRLPNVAHWSVVSALIAGNWIHPGSGAGGICPVRYFTLGDCKEMLDACGMYVAREDHVGETPAVPAELGAYLRTANVEVRGFLERSGIREFLFRAERVPYAQPDPAKAPGRDASWNPAPHAPAATAQSVAVIIPVFNKVDLTRDCLVSIARHYPEAISPEIIVFDNASSDGTGVYLERAQQQYDWLKVIRSPANLGFAGANNKAAQLCDADVLVFLNNDTMVQALWLEKLLERIGDPGVGMIGSKLIYPDDRIQHAGVVLDPHWVPKHIHHLLHRNAAAVGTLMEYPAVTGACIMIRRSLFLELGKMDTEYPMYYEDVDLCFKVREKGYKVLYQPESVVIHLEGRSSANLDAIVKHNEASRAIFLRKWKDFILTGMASDPGFYSQGRAYRPG